MTGYKKILTAIDLTDESSQVINRAKSLANLYNAELNIAHIIEPLGYAYGGDIPMDLTEVQNQLEDHAKKSLKELGEEHQIPIEQQHVII